MKIMFRALAVLAALSFSRPAHATLLTASAGVVERIVNHETQHTGTNWFTVNGVSSLGTCGTATFGANTRVVFAVASDDRGKMQLSILTASLLSGRLVTVTVYDQNKTSEGYCRAYAVELL